MTQETKRAKVGMYMIEYQEYLGEDVNKLVLDLMYEVKKKNPLLSFTVGSNKTSFYDVNQKRREVKMSLKVTHTSDPSIEVGSLGCDIDKKFWVRSRLIRNDKFSHWNSSEHESKKSKHMKNIVKEAGKYLKPFGYEEMVTKHEGDIDRKITVRGNVAVNMANSKLRMDFSAIFPEMLHMHNTGYIPKTPEMAKAIASAVENKEELEKYYNYQPKKCMIWVRPNSVVYEIDKVVKQVNNTSELPDTLREKLFVLDITDKNTFVEDIGMKQDTGIYWVLLEEK